MHDSTFIVSNPPNTSTAALPFSCKNADVISRSLTPYTE